MRGHGRLYRHIFVFGAVVAMIAFAVGVPLGGATTSTPSNPDTIQYVQTTGSNGTYMKYVPGDGSKATTQSITSGGGCATPSPSGVPLLALGAKYYPGGYAGGTVSNAVVGAYKSRTGVCQLGQAWSIEVNEGLVFAVGSNSLTAGRVFSRAEIQLEREDKSTSSSAPVTGQLVERLGTTSVRAVNFSIVGPNGTVITADTGTGQSGFDSVEIRVLTPSVGSVSVVGPTSTFTFAATICPGDSITASSNDVAATFTYTSGSTCKSYTAFNANSTDKSVTFLSQQLAGAHLTAAFDWGYFPNCRADGFADPNVPPCPVTLVDFGDGVFHPATYCAAVDPNAELAPPWSPPPWCVTSRHVDYVLDPAGSGATVARITETWDGVGDIIFKH